MTPPDPAASALAPAEPRRRARKGEGVLSSPPGESTPGTMSPQPSERQAAGKPSPATGAAGPAITPAAPARGRAQTPAGTGTSPTSLRGDGTVPAGSRTFTIALPPGLKLLSLNGREHWSERARRTEALKKAAWAMARQAKIPRLERVAVTVEYQPRDLRRYDAENICAASGKACIDGIVAAGVIEDDECPRYVAGIYCTIGALYPKGRLVLTLTEVAATGDAA